MAGHCRVSLVEPAGARFEKQARLEPVGWLQGAFGHWRGKAVRVRVLFEREVVSWLREQRMHPSPVSQLRSDGRLDVSLLVPLSPNFVSWVVGFGPRVRVVEPKGLAKKVRAEHQAAVASEA